MEHLTRIWSNKEGSLSCCQCFRIKLQSLSKEVAFSNENLPFCSLICNDPKHLSSWQKKVCFFLYFSYNKYSKKQKYQDLSFLCCFWIRESTITYSDLYVSKMTVHVQHWIGQTYSYPKLNKTPQTLEQMYCLCLKLSVFVCVLDVCLHADLASDCCLRM